MIFIASDTQHNLALYYGLKRNHVREILDCRVSEFKKSGFSKNTTDSFDDINVHCFYNELNELSEIEIFRPNEFYIDFNKNLNWINRRNSEILEFLSINNFHGNIEIKDGLVINSYAIATTLDYKLLTECCYVDLEKIPYLNIEQARRSPHKL